jgi:hypothetical protein
MRSCGRRERNFYTAAMAVLPKPYRFSTYVGDLRVTRDTDVFKLSAKLGVDPIRVASHGQRQGGGDEVIQGLAKELDRDPRYLEKFGEESGRTSANRPCHKTKRAESDCFAACIKERSQFVDPGLLRSPGCLKHYLHQ